ncbi:MAG: SPASM domain-containing protein [Magnetococcales bacterium]|nr:SPASM domain-containing protein [Magnetococcales bacterium]
METRLTHTASAIDVEYSRGNKRVLKIGALSQMGEVILDHRPPLPCTKQERGLVEIGRCSTLADNVCFRMYGGQEAAGITNSPLAHLLDCKHHVQPMVPGKIKIGSDVWIGPGVNIFGNVTIGDGAVVEALSVVTEDVPPYAVVTGNPARVKKYRFSPQQIESLLKIAWWNWPHDRISKHANIIFSQDVEALINMTMVYELAPVLEEPLPYTRIGEFRKDYALSFRNMRNLQVEVSSACNLKCPQCSNKIAGHVTKLMTLDIWNAHVKPYLSQARLVHLVGIGEPLLNKHFFTFVDDVLEAGAYLNTTSNLQLVTPAIAEGLLKIHGLSFSCDGVSKETYDAIRINGTFERLTEALAQIVAAKTKAGSDTPGLGLNFGATRRNIHELPDIVHLAARYGVGGIIAFHNIVYDASLKEDCLYHDQERSDEYFLKAAELCKSYGISFSTEGMFKKPRRLSSRLMHCEYPFGHLYICSDGRVKPCCQDSPDWIVLGNLNESSLPEIWNNTATRTLRRELFTEPSHTCRFCARWWAVDITEPRYLFRFPGAEAYIASLSKTG